MLVRRYGIRTGAPAARAMDNGAEMAGAYVSDDAAYETAAADAGTTDGLLYEEDTDEEGENADRLN